MKKESFEPYYDSESEIMTYDLNIISDQIDYPIDDYDFEGAYPSSIESIPDNAVYINDTEWITEEEDISNRIHDRELSARTAIKNHINSPSIESDSEDDDDYIYFSVEEENYFFDFPNSMNVNIKFIRYYMWYEQLIGTRYNSTGDIPEMFRSDLYMKYIMEQYLLV